MLENVGILKTQGQSPLDENKKTGAGTVPAIPLDWKDSPSAKRLLDVISAIIAKEYIETVKKNPKVFSEIASPPSGVHNQTVL